DYYCQVYDSSAHWVF
nr:immunoglobulin light chain junction region [Macaca mulatta]MOW16876.1 immunoglobulin light chain junction region [Macaca mulatta]